MHGNSKMMAPRAQQSGLSETPLPQHRFPTTTVLCQAQYQSFSRRPECQEIYQSRGPDESKLPASSSSHAKHKRKMVHRDVIEPSLAKASGDRKGCSEQISHPVFGMPLLDTWRRIVAITALRSNAGWPSLIDGIRHLDSHLTTQCRSLVLISTISIALDVGFSCGRRPRGCRC